MGRIMQLALSKVLGLAVACTLVNGAALAVWNAQDVVPAATLLVPYAVVDVTADDIPDPTGFTTLFAIVNLSANPEIVHVTAWNCLAVPVIDWDVLLTGYDVWTINFADLLNGRFDKFDTAAGTSTGPFGTAAPSGYTFMPSAYGPSAKATPMTKAAAGWFESTSSRVSGCRMPYGNLNSLGQTIRRKIRAAEISIDYQYYGCVTSGTNAYVNTTWTGDMSHAPLFFYVTADVVNFCTTTLQTSLDYWRAGTNKSANVLTGDIIYFNATHNYSEMLNAVHLEAAPTGTDSTTISTFYSLGLRNATADFFPGSTAYAVVKAADDREPLGDAYAFRYAIWPATVVSNVIVWKSAWDVGYFPWDPTYTAAWGCAPYYYYAWNEDELSKGITGGPVRGESGFNVLQSDAIPFATQSVPLNINNFPSLVNIATRGGSGVAGMGWLWIVFDGGDGSINSSDHLGVGYPYEAWVGVSFSFDNYASAAPATLMNNPWNPGVFYRDNPKPF